MLISDWSSDVCSSDLRTLEVDQRIMDAGLQRHRREDAVGESHRLEQQVVEHLIEFEQRTVDGLERIVDRLEIRLALRVIGGRGAAREQTGRQHGCEGDGLDRKSVVEGKSGAVSVALGGRWISK